MATAEVAAAMLPENEQTTEELSGETATGVTSAATEAKEVVQVEDDEEEWNVAPEETGRPEDSGVGKDEEGGAGTWDDEDDDDDKENI
ncbi:hypothetical protein QQ045_002777 [Rhodiola kirilowii]